VEIAEPEPAVGIPISLEIGQIAAGEAAEQLSAVQAKS
jgi:hypothetical protein